MRSGKMLVGLAALMAAAPVSAAELLMFEVPGCTYCAQWNEEIGPIYPKTAEARCAPLRRVDLARTAASAVGVTRPVTYTPTFVLLDGDHEIGRIQGYPGDMHFWGLLAMLIERLPETSCATATEG